MGVQCLKAMAVVSVIFFIAGPVFCIKKEKILGTLLVAIATILLALIAASIKIPDVFVIGILIMALSFVGLFLKLVIKKL